MVQSEGRVGMAECWSLSVALPPVWLVPLGSASSVDTRLRDLSAGRARTRQPRGPYPSQRCGTDLFLKANQQFDVVKQHVTVVTEFGYFPKLSKKKYI